MNPMAEGESSTRDSEAPPGARRVFGPARLLLGAAMLAVVYIDPSRPIGHAESTYPALALYIVWAAFVLGAGRRAFPVGSHRERLLPWVDAVWFLALIALSGAADSIFFSGLYFAILSASFRRGFASGISITAFSAGGFLVVGFREGWSDPGFPLDRFLLRPIWLVILGFLMACWGEGEVESRRRLALLSRIASLNPRIGFRACLAELLEDLRRFFRAEEAWFVGIDGEEGTLYGVDRGRVLVEPLPPPVVQRLSDAAENGRIRLDRAALASVPAASGCVGGDQRPDPFGGESPLVAPVACGRLSGAVAVPSRKARRRASDERFLAQAARQAAPLLENVLLVDEWIARSARDERRRIARDLHDGAVQSYLGLRMGLAGMRRRHGADPVARDLDRLLDMVDMGIEQIRSYVGDLRGEARERIGPAAALRRHAARFARVTGIAVDVEGVAEDLELDPETAEEAFHLVAEGLSNVRRHTRAARAWISVATEGGRVGVTIGNERRGGVRPFVPRSIEERAAALGGTVRVDVEGATTVRVDLPLARADDPLGSAGRAGGGVPEAPERRVPSAL
jgi:signal transduction histidine kinase